MKRKGRESLLALDKLIETSRSVGVDVDLHKNFLKIMQIKKKELKRRYRDEPRPLEPIRSFDRKGNPVFTP
jgi:hypothetical protein